MSDTRFTCDLFGTDVLRFNQAGYQLRLRLQKEGVNQLADAVADATRVISNLATLPGQPREYFDFLEEEYDGYALISKSEGYDAVPPKSALKVALEAGEALRR